jgi:hypothetical protein
LYVARAGFHVTPPSQRVVLNWCWMTWYKICEGWTNRAISSWPSLLFGLWSYDRTNLIASSHSSTTHCTFMEGIFSTCRTLENFISHTHIVVGCIEDQVGMLLSSRCQRSNTYACMRTHPIIERIDVSKNVFFCPLKPLSSIMRAWDGSIELHQRICERDVGGS